MPKQSEETKLRKRKPANRRGVFTTWGSPTWQSLLARADRRVTDVLAECPAVGAVERDITQSVLKQLWRPPPGDWLLVVETDTQDWVTLVTKTCPGDALQKLAVEFDGRLLLTGHSNSAGTVYARVLERDPEDKDGVALRFEFQSDGTPWDDEDDEGGGESDDDADEEFDELEQAVSRMTETRLVADDLPSDWLQQFDSLPDAHQAVFRHLDAYVPGLCFCAENYELTAAFGHDDILKHVTSIDLVRLGQVSDDALTPEILAATEQLHTAIGEPDASGVRSALAAGALLGPTDGGNSALYNACFHMAYKPYPPRAEIVNVLLDAGADPNDNQPHEDNDYCDTPLSRLISPRPPLDVSAPLVRRLADAGADLNAPSPYPLQLGERPLHHAAKKALSGWVALLLELGADPLARSDAGRTPAQSVEDLIAGKAAGDSYLEEDVERERQRYAPILTMLRDAECAAQD